MVVRTEKYYDFDDVLILPKRTDIKSRQDVNLERIYEFSNGRTLKGVPIIASNMDTVGTLEAYDILFKYNIFTALHKFYSLEELSTRTSLYIDRFNFFSIGKSDKDLQTLEQLQKLFGPKLNICIDVANGYSTDFLGYIAKVRKLYPEAIIMAGNIATPDMVNWYHNIGVDIIKVGLGSGAMCRTRTTAGIGIPQISAIDLCIEQVEYLRSSGAKLYLCADGGVTQYCDPAKALVAGADMVMIGTMFAGHEESGGKKIVGDNGYIYKETYGMSSETAMKKYYGEVADYRASEGRTALIPYKGPLENTVKNLLGSLRSTMTYTNTRNIEDLHLADMIVVNNTHNKSQENHATGI